MALTDTDLRTAWRAMLDRDPALSQTFTKPDLQAATQAVDTWATSATTSYVNALPEPFKSTSTAAQKALLLAYVCLKRAGVI